MKPYLFEDNGTLMIEWIGSTRRFGIWIEKDGDAGWYYASRDDDESGDADGVIERDMLDKIAEYAVVART